MSVLRLNRYFVSPRVKTRVFSTITSQQDEEYTKTPNYPEILDLSFDKKLERKKQSKRDEIKAVKTVEEKQLKLNMPKYYGFKSYILEEERIPYNNLELAQHVTRTHLIESKTLPDYYNNIQLDDKMFGYIKADVEEAILMELDGFRRLHDLRNDDQLEVDEQENLISRAISKKINRAILNNLSAENAHLENAQIDVDSRIESYWSAGGMLPPENVKRYRKSQPWQEHLINEPTDRIMCYFGSANLALRSDLPLLPIIPYSEAENADFAVPYFKYDPRSVGLATDHRHIANVPGFWPGDPNQFGLLSYYKRGHILTRPDYKDADDKPNALHRQAILASFAWLHGQANFLGFTTFNDITYPLVTQTVVTNGQQWSFYVYQLNTMELHSKNYIENAKRNVCWATSEMRLFEEINDGKLVGFNDEVLKMLLKFYLNKPEARLGVNLTPYLSKEEKVSADYHDDEKREWLEREYKYLMANRPRIKLPYEIYAWEKIYKIDNETRFMEKRRRPFELKVKPWNRTLDDRKPGYIPRVLRPHLPRHKGRDANEYWP